MVASGHRPRVVCTRPGRCDVRRSGQWSPRVLWTAVAAGKQGERGVAVVSADSECGVPVAGSVVAASPIHRARGSVRRRGCGPPAGSSERSRAGTHVPCGAMADRRRSGVHAVWIGRSAVAWPRDGVKCYACLVACVCRIAERGQQQPTSGEALASCSCVRTQGVRQGPTRLLRPHPGGGHV